MNPAELLRLMAHAAKNTNHLAIQRQLVDSAWIGVGAIEILGWPGADANGPRRSVLHGSVRRSRSYRSRGCGGGRGITHPHVDGGWQRYVYGDLPQICSIGIENLDAPVAAIGHVDVALRIGRDAVRRIELAGAAAGSAPLFHPVAILVELGDARVNIAIADEDVALRVPGDIGGLPELAVDGGKRRPRMLPRLRPFVGCFLLAPEHHLYTAGG